MILSEQDSGRTVQVDVGTIISVRLNENPTTGYRWTADASTELEQLGDRFAPGEAIGAAGIRELQFRTTKVGSYEIHMKNWREWEGEGSVIDRLDVKIIVK
jgi:predicted secreted protein